MYSYSVWREVTYRIHKAKVPTRLQTSQRSTAGIKTRTVSKTKTIASEVVRDWPPVRRVVDHKTVYRAMATEVFSSMWMISRCQERPRNEPNKRVRWMGKKTRWCAVWRARRLVSGSGYRLGHQTVRNTPTGVKITPVFGLRDGMTRA
jgi:hypothetical protein